MNGLPFFARKTRITTTPTQLMLADLSYALKFKSNESKAITRKTKCKTVARVFGVIQLNSNTKTSLTKAED